MIRKNSQKIIAIMLVLILMISIRAPAGVISPYLWAEDAVVFLQQALDSGWASVMEPYAGYLHMVPRIVTIMILKLCTILHCIAAVPHLMKLTAILWSATIFAYFILGDFDWLIEGKKGRLLVSTIIILLLPQHCFEVWYTITNFQWWAEIFLYIVGLQIFHTKKIPVSKRLSVTLIAIGLSTPVGGLIPLYYGTICLFQFIKTRHVAVRDIMMTILITIPIAIQGYIVLTSERMMRPKGNIVLNTFKWLFTIFPGVFWGREMGGIAPVFMIAMLLCILLLHNNDKIIVFFSYAYLIVCAALVSLSSPMAFSGRYCFAPVAVVLLMILSGISPCFSCDFNYLYVNTKKLVLLKRFSLVFGFFIAVIMLYPSISLGLTTVYTKNWIATARYYDYKQSNENRAWVTVAPGEPWGLFMPINYKVTGIETVNKNRFQYTFDTIDFRPFGDAINGIDINSNEVIIAGWAIDTFAKKSTNGGFIKVGGVYFPIIVGGRQDVAAYFQNINYKQSGISATIPIRHIVTGENACTLVLISSDKTEFIEIPFTFKVNKII